MPKNILSNVFLDKKNMFERHTPELWRDTICCLQVHSFLALVAAFLGLDEMNLKNIVIKNSSMNRA